MKSKVVNDRPSNDRPFDRPVLEDLLKNNNKKKKTYANEKLENINV